MFTHVDSVPEDLTRDERITSGGVSISRSSDVLSPAEKSEELAGFESLRRRACCRAGTTGVDAMYAAR